MHSADYWRRALQWRGGVFWQTDFNLSFCELKIHAVIPLEYLERYSEIVVRAHYWYIHLLWRIYFLRPAYLCLLVKLRVCP